jgi:hypothetical protein
VSHSAAVTEDADDSEVEKYCDSDTSLSDSPSLKDRSARLLFNILFASGNVTNMASTQPKHTMKPNTAKSTSPSCRESPNTSSFAVGASLCASNADSTDVAVLAGTLVSNCVVPGADVKPLPVVSLTLVVDTEVVDNWPEVPVEAVVEPGGPVEAVVAKPVVGPGEHEVDGPALQNPQIPKVGPPVSPTF